MNDDLLEIFSPTTHAFGKQDKLGPPWMGGGKRIESAIRKALFDFNMLDGANGVAVALSGGKDSLTLLYMLKNILGRGFPHLPVIAIHVGGAFSCGAGVDQNYLQKVCADLGVKLIERESKQKLETLACYSCSRERRKLIFDAAKEEGITTIAFGHHRDDSVETLMMNLLQRGEFAGNLPKIEMIKFGVTIIRPLAYIAEKEIIEFAKQSGFARIRCGCPVGATSMRRTVKDQINELETVFPDVRSNLFHAILNYGSTKAAKVSKEILESSHIS